MPTTLLISQRGESHVKKVPEHVPAPVPLQHDLIQPVITVLLPENTRLSTFIVSHQDYDTLNQEVIENHITTCDMN